MSDQIRSRCDCGFSEEYITGAFECNPSESEEVHFRGMLYSTSSDIEAANIADTMKEWLLETDDPKVTVGSAAYNVDPDCDFVYDPSDGYCPTSHPASSVDGAVVGSSIAVVIIVIAIIAALVIVVVVLVRRVRGPGKYGTGDAR